MGDWNKPALSDQYADFLTYLKAIITDAATLFVSDPSNTPTGAIRWNRSTSLFEEYNGTSWAVKTLAIAGGGTGATSASAARTALSAAVTGANGDITSLTACTALTSSGALALSSTGANIINLASAAAIWISSGGTGRWFFDSSGHQTPNHDNTYNIGSAVARIKKMWAIDLQTAHITFVGSPSELLMDTTDGSDNKSMLLGHATRDRGAYLTLAGNEHASTPGKCVIRSGNVTGGDLDIGASGAQDLILTSSNVARWRVKDTGNFVPNSSNAFDIGASGNKVKDLYLAGDLLKDIATWVPSVSAGGSMTIGSVTTYQALYQKIGAFVYFDLAIIMTLGGTASGVVNVSLPIAGVAHNVNTSLICNIDSPSGTVANGGRWRQDGSNLILFKPANANFELGATSFFVQGHYRYV